jgi:hypothetical protein
MSSNSKQKELAEVKQKLLGRLAALLTIIIFALLSQVLA